MAVAVRLALVLLSLVSGSTVWAVFPLSCFCVFSLSVSKERAATQELTNSSTWFADTAACHRPENRNFFQSPTAAANLHKGLLTVRSVRRDESRHRESRGSLGDECCGWPGAA